MYKRILIFTFFITILLSSCRNNQQPKELEPKMQDTTLLDSLNPKPDTDTISAKNEEESLHQVIQKIASGYVKQCNSCINEYILPELGLYIIYRPGAMDTYSHVSHFNFNKPLPAYYFYPEIPDNKITAQKMVLKMETLPVFDCAFSKWNKTGFYCDNTKRPHQLSETATYMNEISDSKIPAKELQLISQIEKRSYRVILNPTNDSNYFIFHVTKWNNKWYLTVIDRSYGNCDA